MNTPSFPAIASLENHDPFSWFRDPRMTPATLGYLLVHGMVDPSLTDERGNTLLDAFLQRLDAPEAYLSLRGYPETMVWPTSLDEPWPTVDEWKAEGVLALLVAHARSHEQVLKAFRAAAGATRERWAGAVLQCLNHPLGPTAEELNASDAPASEGFRTPQPWLHVLTRWGNVALLTAFLNRKGVNPNVHNSRGESALFEARSVSVATALLQAGCDPRAANHRGEDAANAWSSRIGNTEQLEGLFEALAAFGGSRGSQSDLLLTLSAGELRQVNENTFAALLEETTTTRATPKGTLAFFPLGLFAITSAEALHLKYHSEHERLDALLEHFPVELFRRQSLPGFTDGELIWAVVRATSERWGTQEEPRRRLHQRALQASGNADGLADPLRQIATLATLAAHVSATNALAATAGKIVEAVWTQHTLLPAALAALSDPNLSRKTAWALAETLSDTWPPSSPPRYAQPRRKAGNPGREAAFHRMLENQDDGRFLALLFQGYVKAVVHTSDRGLSQRSEARAMKALAERWVNAPKGAEAFGRCFKVTAKTMAKFRQKDPDLARVLDAWTMGACLPTGHESPRAPRLRF